ncbi:MAG TPA: hypothetical protein VHV08_05290, partial [Pirellulales bacterium]|nr:hypothetical protein [Pirellulales bacterium]
MSTHPANALSPNLMSAAPAKQGRPFSIAGLSVNGGLLFTAAFLVVASGFSSLRPEVMGLALHPSLVPIALAFPFVLMSRIGEFPMRVLSALVLFVAMYCFSVCNGTNIAIGEIFKIVAGGITIVTCALLVRRRGDFVAGALGLSLAIALLAWHGLQEPAKGGVEAMQGANKNSYSLFALPAMLIAGFIYLRMPVVPAVIRNLFVICTLPALLAIFMSANRSGYLGAALIGLMLFWDRRGKGLLLVGILAAAVAFLMVHFKATEVFDRRMKQTIGKNESD